MILSDNIRRKRWSAFLWALGLNALIAFVAFKFSHMEFGTNDDRDISNLLANVNGSPNSYYITFVNIILCKALYLLYDLTNNYTNWYVLISVIGSFCALTSISYVLILRSPGKWFGICLAAIMAGLLYESHYIIFQFTQNAALLTMAGCLLLADAVLFGREKCGYFQCLVGIGLAVFGSLIRFQSIVFTFPYLIMYVGYETVFVRKPSGFRAWFTERWPQLTAVVVCLALVLAARAFHSYKYSTIPLLKDFNEENLLRAELLDYGFPSYEENAEEIQKLGISEEDFTLFANQCFLDKDVFDRETLEALVEMKSEQSSSYSVSNLKLSSVADVVDSIRTDLENNLVWQIILLCCIVFLCITSRKRWLVALGSLTVPMVMMWYFISVNRMPYRIWYSIVAPPVISMLYLCAVGSCEKLKKLDGQGVQPGKILKWMQRICASLLAAGLVLVGISVYQRAAEDDSVRITDTYENILDLAAEYPEKLILLDRPTISSLTYTSTISPMTVLESGSHSNICYQGGWLCWTPGNMSVLGNFGITNVYEAIGQGMDVFLVDGRTPEMKLDFIRRHYNPNVCMEQIGTIKGSKIGVYRFSIQDGTVTGEQ